LKKPRIYIVGICFNGLMDSPVSILFGEPFFRNKLKVFSGLLNGCIMFTAYL
jgi:hypothetical protein